MKPIASNDLIAGARYEWAKHYKTNIQESRLRKELGPLGDEKTGKVLLSLRTFLAQTPPQFFSWNKWRDSWLAFVPEEGPSAQEMLSKLLSSYTGYAPAVGIYWTIPDIQKRFGPRVAKAIEKIGGVKRLNAMASGQKQWIEKEFVEAYG